MTHVAIEAEHKCHHPEWSNVYNRVKVLLTTHDVKGLSKKDIDLAKYIDNISAKNHMADDQEEGDFQDVLTKETIMHWMLLYALFGRKDRCCSCGPAQSCYY
ncbi:Pterin-4-alpha-carbinolamine dehydratase 2 [Cichlidogyrus casuarinus]|uniref:4a-hydroxytetrahydrobiopterin dehydratase n=1 Tax=Cichlidogyrus casuarinus TaxID=1844966 RepID=A0ABD2PIP1_9PLAT